MNKQTAQKYISILEKTKNLLKEKGWCKGEFSNKNGQYCAFGAIKAVEHDNVNQCRLRDLLEDNIPKYYTYKGTSKTLISFNDYRLTKFSNIIALFNRTIRNLSKLND